MICPAKSPRPSGRRTIRACLRAAGVFAITLAFGGLATAQDATLMLTPAPVATSIAGTGRAGYQGDNAPATAATLAAPSALVYDAAGNLLFADTRNHAIRRIAMDGTIAKIAGTGRQGFSGDNGMATAADLDSPSGIANAADGSLYIADTRNHRVRKVASNGTIATIAGTGAAGFSGDFGPATQASLRNPGAVLVGAAGEIYIADTGNHRVRRVALDGTITTVAGSGVEAATGDGGPAIAAALDSPSGLALRADGALLIADRMNSLIRVVTADGQIDSLPQSSLPVRRASGISFDSNGTLYVADTAHHQVRAVTASGGGVLLGSGEQGAFNPASSVDQTPTGAPLAVAPDLSGGFAVTDRDNHQVQHVALAQISFGTTQVGQHSLTKTLDLRNGGTAPITLTSVTLPPGFASANGSTCGALPIVLAGAAHCSLSLAFAPDSSGIKSGSIQISIRNGLSQRAILTGTAVPSGTTVPSSVLLQSSGSLSYLGVSIPLSAKIIVGSTASPTGTVQLLDATKVLVSQPVGTNGTAQFSINSLTAGQHTLAAQYSGDVNYAASTSPSIQQTVVLAPDFTLAAASPQISTTAGTPASMLLTLQPINGTLNRPVTLAFSGLPSGATATASPTPLMLGSDAITVTLALQTPAAAALHKIASASLVLIALVACGPRRHRLSLLHGICFAIVFATLGIAGCSGGYLNGTSTSAQSVGHTYPVTVTATTTGVTGDRLVHTTTFTLVVN